MTGNPKGRIINVTHQIPYELTLEKNGWNITPRRGHGAMYGGIHSLQHEWDILYIGWTGQINKIEHKFDGHTKEPIDHLNKLERAELYNNLKENYQCIPLFVDGESVSGHYDGYCKTSKKGDKSLIMHTLTFYHSAMAFTSLYDLE
jgi:trehalose 6-phosphate synthase/phosphatase